MTLQNCKKQLQQLGEECLPRTCPVCQIGACHYADIAIPGTNKSLGFIDHVMVLCVRGPRLEERQGQECRVVRVLVRGGGTIYVVRFDDGEDKEVYSHELKEPAHVTGTDPTATPDYRDVTAESPDDWMGFMMEDWERSSDSKNATIMVRFMECLKILTDEQQSPDRALYWLLKTHEDRLPKLNERFLQMFRQTDVTGNGEIDMAIYHLIATSKRFEQAYQYAHQGAKA